MQKSKLQLKIQELRKQNPRFIYEDFSYQTKNNNLEISFNFSIEPDIKFQPKIIIEKIPKKTRLSSLDNLVFHLGLMEIPTYWKATCSPKIEIRAGHLNREQVNWWRRLIINGLSQFFYENKIDWRPRSFLTIKSLPGNHPLPVFNKKLKNRYLVPFAGGRDSIVTLESLKKSASWRKETALFLVNPNEQMGKTAKVTGVKKQIIIERSIDKKLLQLNKRGYLNGHTPFTALLSFLSVLCAVLFDYKNIVFSNEKSADEGNLKYLGKMINHQWAKSSQFEKMFKKYCKKYLAKNINYFSYLRKYGELEISQMFIKYPKYFSVFSSCNASMRIGARQIRWCGNCPKCLFVYATLYPFLNRKDLLKIFRKDIFDPSTSSGREKLLPIMKSLIGQGRPKPFECVGTKKESRMAFKSSLEKALRRAQGKPTPYLLLEYIKKLKNK
ncbi:MAG TPA: hypothetical protein VMV66_03085 [Candidatus Humimicrobiaceae bacterium]|nr:hypothetical protein [Candidatus Humimicrobiaceae bacterium]